MALTLDSKPALTIIDLQKGIVGRETAPYPASDVVTKSAALATAFRKKNLPVVLVHVLGGAPGRTDQKMSGTPAPDWAEFVPELNRQPSDHIVAKKTWGAFTNTDLDAHLRSLGVTQIVLCGIATSIGVESTARFASELGYNVALVTDAMTDLNAEAHKNSLEKIFPRLGECGTAADVIKLLA